MAIMAKWGDKKFEVSPNRVKAISDFSTTYAIKDDTNEDTSGTAKTNTRGRKAEEPSFSVKYLAAAGANPRNDFTSWRSLVGKKNYLYIGSTKYGVNKFELRSASVSDVVLDSKGRTIQAVVTLQFLEIITTKKKATSTKSSGKTTKSTKGTNEEAKSATASKTDKSLKSPYSKKG